MLEIEKLNHIEISREDSIRPYRFHSNPNAPRPPIRDRKIHGKKLENELNEATKQLSEQREKLGIEPDKLMVISFINEAMPQELMNNMISKFNLSLVEEISQNEENITRILVQFPDSYTMSQFNRERELWEVDNKEDAILTYAKRRDIFACINSIRLLNREDRIGPRLKARFERKEELPEGYFFVDIDIWYDQDRKNNIEIESSIKKIFGTVGGNIIGDLFETQSLLLGRARINQFALEALLNCDLIAFVDFPLGTIQQEPCELLGQTFDPIVENSLDDTAPLATILDSGLFSGHPLLKNTIVAEEDFDNTENSVIDNNGHGTGVAGIVVYGDFFQSLTSRVFRPLVRICNGKVMHDNNGYPEFNQEVRPEKVINDAIIYFNKEFGCRVFNLSAGDADMVYNLGRQMPWAEVLDKLSRELDIIIIISAGNVFTPQISPFNSREELWANCRNNLFNPEHRLIDPATASLCVTVGSITRYDEPELAKERRSLRLSVGPQKAPSVFTRVGFGINKSIKPELVGFGGNYALHQISHGNSRWVKNDQILMEPTLNFNNAKLFKAYCGTSFSAPHITHLAARIERAIQLQISDIPSANLVRAMLVNSARISDEIASWAEQSKDKFHKGKDNPMQEKRMRLLGYGLPNDSWLYSGRNHVTLFAEDELDLRSFHLYKIPVPIEFLEVKNMKRISISLAYNPVTRLSRKDYLSCHLWFEVYRRIDETTLAKYKARKEAGQEVETDPLPGKYKAAFYPGYTEVEKSTLQQRIWKKGPTGGKDLVSDEEDPCIYILVAGKERYKFEEQNQPQSYAIVVTFSFDGEQEIQLYNKLRQRARIRDRQRERERARAQQRV